MSVWIGEWWIDPREERCMAEWVDEQWIIR